MKTKPHRTKTTKKAICKKPRQPQTMNDESLETPAWIEVKEEPPEKFALELAPSTGDSTQHEDIKPLIIVDVKEESLDNFVPELPPSTSEQLHNTRSSKRQNHASVDHQRKAHNDDEVMCEVCSKVFESKDALRSHLACHVKVECPVCHMMVPPRNQKRHMRLHSTELGKCTLCEYSTVHKSNLERHIRRMHKSKPIKKEFECDSCTKSFALRRHLNEHKEICYHGKLSAQATSTPPASEISIVPSYDDEDEMSSEAALQEQDSSACQEQEQEDPLQEHEQEEALQKQEIFQSSGKNKKTKRSSKMAKKTHMCHFCAKIFQKKVLLRIHIDGVHLKIRKFSCDLCPKKYRDKAGMQRHIEGFHMKIRRFSCSLCRRKFSQRQTLQLHVTRYHVMDSASKRGPRRGQFCDIDKEVMCDVCGKTCKNQTLLNIHLQSHIKTECPVCHKMVIRRNHHMRLHSTESHFKCTLCDYSAVLKIGLERHTNRVHLLIPIEKKFKCDSCTKSFEARNHLRRHKIFCKNNGNLSDQVPPASEISIGDEMFSEAAWQEQGQDETLQGQAKSEKPSKCQFCSKILATKGGLRMHIEAVHQKIKNFSCHICPKKFHIKANLEAHIEGVHQKIRNFSCNICPMKFRAKQNLQLHLVGTHLLDPKSVNTSMLLMAHQKIKNLPCNLCPKKFDTPQNLRMHIESFHQRIKNLACHICPKKFRTKVGLQAHIEGVHEKIKNYSCNLCPKKFRAKQRLQTHLVRIHLLVHKVSKIQSWFVKSSSTLVNL